MLYTKSIEIKQYSGDNIQILKLIKLINESALKSNVIIHGSFGDYGEIRYSDFDGLIIITDKLINSEGYKKFIKESLKIIYRIDPLQHHGWFVIKESHLLTYPQTYFPYEIFEFTKSLTGNNINLEITLGENYDYLTPFIKAKESVVKLVSSNKPNNLYQLKSFLSEFMLLPSLYLQAKNKKGIYKKFSFDLAKIDFTDEEWAPIVIASNIRQNWEYKLNYIQRLIMTRPESIFRKLTKHFVAPRIPKHYLKLLDEEYYSKCLDLMNIMKIKLYENYK